MSSGQRLGIRKSRTSCNRCSVQNIHCDRERPRCGRCVARAVECKYVVGTRGRPSRSAFENASNITSDLKSMETNQLPTESKLSSLDGWRNSSSSMATTAQARSARLTTYLAAKEELGNSGSLSDEMDQGVEQSEVMGALSPLSPVQQSRPGPTTASIQPLEFHSSHAESTTRPALISHATFPVYEWSGSNRLYSSRSRSCCMKRLFECILDMHIQSSACKDSSTDSTRVQSWRERRRWDIDTILFRNREAVRVISRVLKCNCSSDPTVSFAAYLLALETVSAYGMILGIRSTSQGDGRSSASGHVVARPIFLGGYRLNKETQDFVTAHVVAQELRAHVEPLLSRLPVLASSSVFENESSRIAPAVLETNCALRSQFYQLLNPA